MAKKFLIASLLIFIFSYTAAEAVGVPTIFSYQGRLTNASGNLLGSSSGTTYYFKFSIWNVSTGGVAGTNRLWPSSDPSSQAISVRQGVFNVDIDTTTYNFNTDDEIYLQVEVSADNVTFETLDPRQRISAAPFAQVAGAVSGTGPSSFGTTAPFGTSVVSVQATSTQSTGLSIRGVLNQLANLFQIQDSTGANLFMVDASGRVGVGTSTATRKFNILDADSAPQLRVSQSTSAYGELRADSAGDVRISSAGGNIRQNNENLWVCSGDGCAMDATPPADKGNVIVETGVIFDNNFKFKLKENPGATTTTIMLDSLGNEILEFDESQ